MTLDSAEELDTNSTSNSTGSSLSLSSDIALSVEQCHCPANYTGTSCEVRIYMILLLLIGLLSLLIFK